MGSGGIATPILTSALDGEWSASRFGRFIPRGKSPWHPLNKGLGGPQSRSGSCGEEKNLLPLQRFELQPVARRYTDCLPALGIHVMSV
jgi:hypothetical protein